MGLQEDKEMLEEALQKLNLAQQKRMRLEGQYESSMEALKKLGYDSIQEAAIDYKEKKGLFDAELVTLSADVAFFLKEFNIAFAGTTNV